MLAAWTSVVALPVELCRAAAHVLPAYGGLGSVGSVAVTALAVAALVGALAVCLDRGARLGRACLAVPLVGRAAALREKSWRAAFLRQRDPDAAGRPRPRAPSAARRPPTF